MDGIILINKGKGYTSHDVVNKVKHVFNEKVGHTGTLDPNATGLLPILIGKGTKLSYYLINHDKEYEVTLKLGEKTDTADSEGKIIERQSLNNDFWLNEGSVERVREVLKTFIGRQMQTPPMYSAIKVNGKKLYEYARKNIDVEVKPREIEIYNIMLNKIDKKNFLIYFTVHCSKGTYIRSLCEDIAKKLGTIGYMKELNRTKVGIFDIKASISIEELTENIEKDHIISIEDLFIRLYGNNNKINLDDKKVRLFLNGVQLKVEIKTNSNDGLFRVYGINGEFIGIGSVKAGLLKREIC